MAKRPREKKQGQANVVEPEEGPPEASPPSPAAGWRTASILLALAGLLVSIILIYIYFRLVGGAGTYHSFCAISPTVNCDDVLTSPYGKILGIPVQVLGALDYVLLLVLLALGGRASGRSLAYALLLAGWNLLVSIYMATLSAFVLHQLCLLCAVLYVLNLALPFTIAMAWKRPLLEPFTVLVQDVKTVPRRPALYVPLLSILAVGFIALFASLASEDKARVQQDKINQFMQYFLSQPQETMNLPASLPSKGSPRPLVTFVEFSDFQCPHCKKGADVMREVLEHWGDRVRLVFRNYPLDNTCNDSLVRQVHENACRAAVAAHCAQQQGKFWEYHDLLFANQDYLRMDDLVGYAGKAGLKVDDFKGCMNDPRGLAVVREDIQQANLLKVDSTPTFFINGRKLPGALPLEFYARIIEYESRARPSP